MSRLRLLAPLPGWALPLEQVPDPVFADGIAGAGVAIDPTAGLVHAPCDGEVMVPGNAHHALIVRSGAAEILIHVGIDTVALGGEGFSLQVAPGQRVLAGQPLLRFDLDLLARRARSVVTPVLATAGGRLLQCVTGRALAVGDFLMEIEADAATATISAEAGGQRRAFQVPFEHGLHARPAALVASTLRPFQAQVTVHAHGRDANARSTVALMALGLQRGERIEVSASGSDAPAALSALGALLAADAVPVRGAAPRSCAADAHPLPQASTPGPGGVVRSLAGVVAAPGMALGRAVQLVDSDPELVEEGRGVAHEQAALAAALASVQAWLEGRMHAAIGDEAAILAAHIELCRDPELVAQATALLQRGASAAHAWRQALRATAGLIAALDDPHLRARVADLRDLERQVLRVLAGESLDAVRRLPADAIVLADELLPSQLAALEGSQLAGICMAAGGATSHVALLAMARGIPVLVGMGARLLEIPEGAALLLDAERGRLQVDPPASECAALATEMAHRQRQRATELATASSPCATRDGTAVAVYANLGATAEVAGAVDSGAEGCGLLRTEFLFLSRRDPPDEDEQAREYAAIAASLAGRPLTVRTFDPGGDKPLAYLPAPREDNPALGMRGIRAHSLQPALLRSQLRALLRTHATGPVRILLPMVNEVAELRLVRGLLAACAAELGVTSLPALGVMVETPAAALLADQLAAEADFLSLGSNDLAQYTLAIDRAHPLLAARLDALHPAVLRLIAQVARAARAAACPLAVCGGLASDPLAVPLLLGLGVRELSVVPALIPRIKQGVRELDLAGCQALATAALDQPDAPSVRALVARVLRAGSQATEPETGR